MPAVKMRPPLKTVSAWWVIVGPSLPLVFPLVSPPVFPLVFPPVSPPVFPLVELVETSLGETYDGFDKLNQR
jgi:hypothetical protein